MRTVHSIFAALLLITNFGASASGTTDFKDCPQFFVGGRAPIVGNVEALRPRALCFQNFAVLHSGTTKTPVYVVEKLNRALLQDAKGEKRHDKFFADARLPRAERAELEDYKNSNFDRGHFAPAADQPNDVAMEQSFSLANMSPQNPYLNRKVWAGIEKATRKYAMRAEGDVYVVTGAVFDPTFDHHGPKVVGANNVGIPSHYYKLVYDATSGRGWAHWQENSDEARGGRPITYQELVKRTGIEFFPGVNVKS